MRARNQSLATLQLRVLAEQESRLAPFADRSVDCLEYSNHPGVISNVGKFVRRHAAFVRRYAGLKRLAGPYLERLVAAADYLTGEPSAIVASITKQKAA